MRLPATGPMVQKPMAGSSTELGAEVANQGRGGHQDRSLDNADQARDDGIRPLAGGQWNTDGGEQPDDQQSVNHHVGAAQPIRPAGRQRGETRPTGSRRR